MLRVVPFVFVCCAAGQQQHGFGDDLNVVQIPISAPQVPEGGALLEATLNVSELKKDCGAQQGESVYALGPDRCVPMSVFNNPPGFYKNGRHVFENAEDACDKCKYRHIQTCEGYCSCDCYVTAVATAADSTSLGYMWDCKKAPEGSNGVVRGFEQCFPNHFIDGADKFNEYVEFGERADGPCDAGNRKPGADTHLCQSNLARPVEDIEFVITGKNGTSLVRGAQAESFTNVKRAAAGSVTAILQMFDPDIERPKKWVDPFKAYPELLDLSQEDQDYVQIVAHLDGMVNDEEYRNVHLKLRDDDGKVHAVSSQHRKDIADNEANELKLAKTEDEMKLAVAEAQAVSEAADEATPQGVTDPYAKENVLESAAPIDPDHANSLNDGHGPFPVDRKAIGLVEKNAKREASHIGYTKSSLDALYARIDRDHKQSEAAMSQTAFGRAREAVMDALRREQGKILSTSAMETYHRAQLSYCNELYKAFKEDNLSQDHLDAVDSLRLMVLLEIEDRRIIMNQSILKHDWPEAAPLHAAREENAEYLKTQRLAVLAAKKKVAVAERELSSKRQARMEANLSVDVANWLEGAELLEKYRMAKRAIPTLQGCSYRMTRNAFNAAAGAAIKGDVQWCQRHSDSGNGGTYNTPRWNSWDTDCDYIGALECAGYCAGMQGDDACNNGVTPWNWKCDSPRSHAICIQKILSLVIAVLDVLANVVGMVATGGGSLGYKALANTAKAGIKNTFKAAAKKSAKELGEAALKTAAKAADNIKDAFRGKLTNGVRTGGYFKKFGERLGCAVKTRAQQELLTQGATAFERGEEMMENPKADMEASASTVALNIIVSMDPTGIVGCVMAFAAPPCPSHQEKAEHYEAAGIATVADVRDLKKNYGHSCWNQCGNGYCSHCGGKTVSGIRTGGACCRSNWNGWDNSNSDGIRDGCWGKGPAFNHACS